MSDFLLVLRSLHIQLARIGQTGADHPYTEKTAAPLLDCFERIDIALADPDAQTLRPLLLELTDNPCRIVLPDPDDTSQEQGGTGAPLSTVLSRGNEVQRSAEKLRAIIDGLLKQEAAK